MRPIIDDLIQLKTGVEVQVKQSDDKIEKRTVRMRILCTILDLPATKKLFFLKGSNGECGCSFCLNPGVPVPNNPLVRHYLCDKQFALRDSSSMKKAEEALKRGEGIDGVIGVSIMSEYSCILELLTIDPMHNSFLGNCLRILKLFVCSSFHEYDWYISPQNQEKLDGELTSVKLPSIYHKNIRSIIKDLPHFKADELRIFALYLLPVFKKYIKETYHEFLDTFRDACRIACSKNPTTQELKKAGVLFQNLSISSKRLFGKYCGTINMHYFEHVGIFLEKFGPFYNYSSFPYEGLIGIFMSFRTGTYRFQQHMCWMFNTYYYLDQMEKTYAFNDDMKLFLNRLGSPNFPLERRSIRVSDNISLVGKSKVQKGTLLNTEIFRKCCINGFIFVGREKSLKNKTNDYSCKYVTRKTVDRIAKDPKIPADPNGMLFNKDSNSQLIEKVEKVQIVEEKRGEIIRFEKYTNNRGNDMGTRAIIVPLEHKQTSTKELSIPLEDIVEPLIVVRTENCFYTSELVGPMNDQYK